MSIIRMQKVAVLGLDADKKRLMSELMDLGVVELTDCSAMSGEDFRNINLTQDAAPETVELFEKKVFDAAQALEVLEKYGEIKEPLFHTRRRVKKPQFKGIGESEEQTRAKIDKLLNLAEKIKNASDRINRMESDTAMLTPWKSFDLSLAERGTQTTDITLGVIPKTDFRSFSEVTEKLQSASAEGENAEAMQYCMIKQVSEDKDYMYAALVTGKEETKAVMMQLREIGFSELNLSAFAGTADENLKQLNKEKQEAEETLQKLKEEIKNLKAWKEPVEDYADYFTVEADKERSREKLLRTSETFLLEGWLPVRTKARVTQILDENNACYQFRDPEEGEEVPVLLENKSFFQPTEAITEMYSLPSYWGFDPTSIYSLFYIIFFGMMFSDAGYGLLLAIGCGVILKKFDLEGTTFKMIKLFFYCGISTTVWGVLFGGFFGDLIGVFSNTFLGKQIAFNAVWFNPLEDPMKLLIFSLILGVIHLFIGMGIQAFMQIKDGKFVDAVCDEGFWYLTILGLCAWLCGSAAFDSAVLSTAGMWMSIAGAIGLLIAGGRGRKGIGKIVGGFSNLYNITSWISDILSYARLLALGLATGVIAQVVNTMGSLFGGGIAGLILFLLIFAVGHAVNFAINLLGAFIHSARLQYVEFFGKFYVDGGEPFDPLRRKTKYIRVDEE